MSSATEDFRRELATLRDGLVQAIDRGVLGEIEDGFDVYADLVRAVLRSYRPLEERLHVRPRTWRSTYGRVMEWLQEDLFLFARRSLSSGEVEAVRAMLEMLNGVLSDCVSEDEVDAHRTVLSVFEQIWRLGPELLLRGWDEIRRSELAWLTSHLEYRLGPAAEDSLQAAKGDFVRQVLSTIVTFAKTAIDDDRNDDLEEAVDSLGELFQRLTLRSDERRELTEGAAHLLLLREVYALALEGYVLMRLRFGRSSPEEAKAQYQIVSRASQRHDPWITMWHLQHPELIGNLDFRWWELALFEGRAKGGWLGFEQDVTIAFSLRLLDGRADANPPLDELRELTTAHDLRFFLERIVEQGLDSERLRETLTVLERPLTGAESAKAEVASAVDVLKAEEARSTAALPISPLRVERFMEALVQEWAQRTPLRHLVRLDLVTEDDTPTEDRVVYGMHQLLPKEFFADTHVHAEPDNIGRDYGRAIARGETAQGLVALEQVNSVPIELQSVHDHVTAALAELLSEGMAPAVLIVNSWRLRQQVLQGATADDEDGRCGEVGSAPAYFEYADGADQVVVADFREGVALRRLPLTQAAPWEHVLAKGQLLAGVHAIDEERAVEMISGNEEFRRGPDGRFMTVEDAALSLRQRVEAKAHTRFEWSVVQHKAIRRFVVLGSER